MQAGRAQAVYPVGHDGLSPNTRVAPTFADIAYISTYLDPSAGMEVMFWRDIRAMFVDAAYIRHNSRTLDFLKDANGNTLVPLRVAALHRAVIEVVVDAPLKPPAAHDQSKVRPVSVSVVNPTAVRQSPSSGSVEASTENSVHNHSQNSACSQDDHESQSTLHHTGASTSNGNNNNNAESPSPVAPVIAVSSKSTSKPVFDGWQYLPPSGRVDCDGFLLCTSRLNTDMNGYTSNVQRFSDSKRDKYGQGTNSVMMPIMENETYEIQGAERVWFMGLRRG
ncbi:hypothetical protein BGZ95_000754 [Linnemannia exigua]|uniref:Uncharacterized protein n=1 Tax=Linnemannia exigua TaxID=604196 RepID=A0AAD4D7W1_9FUNG|nr:hypothetical protein BGZ95_000754 [Linnemannia exigua]